MRCTTPAVPSRGRLVRWSRIAALRTQACAQTGRTNAGGGNESEWAHNVRRAIDITHVLVWLLAVIAVTVGLSVLSVVFSILACVVNTSPDIGSNWCVAGRRAVHANMYARARV